MPTPREILLPLLASSVSKSPSFSLEKPAALEQALADALRGLGQATTMEEWAEAEAEDVAMAKEAETLAEDVEEDVVAEEEDVEEEPSWPMASTFLTPAERSLERK